MAASASSRPLFYILDGHALAYRYFFAQSTRPLTTSRGEVVSAIYGFARGLLDVLLKERPRYIAVSFDDGFSGREQIYTAYKAHRAEMPDDLQKQIDRIQALVQAFNIPILMYPGYEADDLIGTVARQAEAQGVDVTIFSGDRDLLQLLTDHTRVRLYIPQRSVPDEYFDVTKFREKYGLEPTQLIDLKALQGDSSDNIPGVAGIGEKGATALLQQFGSIEELYARLDEVKEGMRKKLEAGRDSAFLSKDLATIRRDVPFEFDLNACVAHDFDATRVEALLRELEFTSLLEPLGRLVARRSDQMALFDLDAFAPAETSHGPVAELSAEEWAARFPTVIVRDADGLAALAQALAAAPRIAFDVETTSLDQMSAGLVGIALAVDAETGYYIPVGHDHGVQLPLDAVMDAIRPALTDPAIPKVAHNASFDLLVMRRHGVDVTPVTFDTMIAEWVRDPASESLGLKRLARRELHIDMTPIDALIGRGKKQISMEQVDLELVAPYAAADAVCTYRLVDALHEKLRAIERPPVDSLWGTPNPPVPLDVFETIEMPLVPVIAAMEEAGVLLDTEFLAAMSARLADDLAALEAEIYALSGGYGPFNINSPKQLNDVLFGKLGLKAEGVRKTTHGFSTAADVLDNLRGEHPIIEKILQYRELGKLKGTYVDALPALINPRTGRVHTSYNQTGAATGRLSSSNPNLQNIPIRTDLGREVRRAFITAPGTELLAVDYSQVELRIMAHISREPTLLEAFKQGQDIHAATAALIYNIPLEAVTKAQRIFAKRINFGILYGMGAYRLARDSDLTLAQAEAFIKTYFERLPGVEAYIKNAKRLAREQGYLTTLFGRRRMFPGLRAGNRNIQQAAEREAINMPIQGTAADIIKRAMIDLHREIERRGLGARLILQVHDELVLEVPEPEVETTAALVVQTMEGACELAAPLRANAQRGKNWLEMVDIVPN
ncbi:MAG: DNA polymerase I [Aggregatilineales bacterium]